MSVEVKPLNGLKNSSSIIIFQASKLPSNLIWISKIYSIKIRFIKSL